MAQKTSLSLSGTPGRVYTFSAKSENFAPIVFEGVVKMRQTATATVKIRQTATADVEIA